MSKLVQMMRPALIGGAAFIGTAGLLLATGQIAPAAAQALGNHDANAPVDFAADSIELQSRADRVVITGNVNVRQAGLTLTAARMTIAYTDTRAVDVNRIDATGGVTMTKGGDTARGDFGTYDLDRRLVTLIGNVQLRQSGNTLSGARLVIDLTSGRATIDGRAGAGGTTAGNVPGATTTDGGRVTGRFTVPRRD